MTAAAAQSLRSRLLELSSEADSQRKTEKKPHFDAAQAVDARWMPWVKQAKDVADVIRTALGRYETRKLQAYRAAQAEEERKRQEELARQRRADRDAAPPAQPTPQPSAAPPPAANKIKGGYGRAATSSVKLIAVVTDQDKLYEAVRDHAALKEALAKIAQHSLDKAGLLLPGCKQEETAVVR